MYEYQKRVVKEAEELYEKIFALDKFINSDNFSTSVLVQEQARLVRQFNAMKTYHSILVERIENFCF